MKRFSPYRLLFEGRKEERLVLPDKPNTDQNRLLKAESFDALNFEIETIKLLS